jgi:hypothetical protein
MDFLTAEDWKDLGYTFLGGLAALAIFAGFRIWKNQKAGKPALAMAKWQEAAQNGLWIFGMVLMLPLMDILERHGQSTFWAATIQLIVIVPIIFFSEMLRKRALRNSVANPNAASVAAPPPSKEEVRVNLLVNAAVIAFGVVTVGPILYLAFWSEASGLAMFPYVLAFTVIPFALLTFAISGRLPGSITKRSEIEIEAAPQEVWNTIRFRNTTNWWKKIVSSVERTSDPGEWYRLRYFNNDTCAQCGLPRDPGSEGHSNIVEILSSDEPHRLHFRAHPKRAGGAMGTMMDYEETVLTLEALEGGRTRVTSMNTAVRPKAWLAFILKIGDPSGEELRTLKGYLEGKSFDTIFDIGVKRLDEARHAEKFCGCGADAPVAGRFA